ncbi:MAG: response regulator [Alkalispirochaetaceae bacterium]
MERTVRILLVEDNLINQKVMGQILSKLPAVSLESVESGEDALELLCRERFDLVLMDLQLEGMSGIEAVRRIRELSNSATPRSVVVVILSGYSDREQQRLATLAGADGYMLKPVDTQLLAQLIEQVRSSTI